MSLVLRFAIARFDWHLCRSQRRRSQIPEVPSSLDGQTVLGWALIRSHIDRQTAGIATWDAEPVIDQRQWMGADVVLIRFGPIGSGMPMLPLFERAWHCSRGPSSPAQRIDCLLRSIHVTAAATSNRRPSRADWPSAAVPSRTKAGVAWQAAGLAGTAASLGIYSLVPSRRSE